MIWSCTYATINSKSAVHWKARALPGVRFEDQQLTSFAGLDVATVSRTLDGMDEMAVREQRTLSCLLVLERLRAFSPARLPADQAQWPPHADLVRESCRADRAVALLEGRRPRVITPLFARIAFSAPRSNPQRRNCRERSNEHRRRLQYRFQT